VLMKAKRKKKPNNKIKSFFFPFYKIIIKITILIH
jgi:hypothetical protein